jgi:hypothetical protein
MVAAMSSLASQVAQLARLSPRQRDVLEAFPDGCLDTTAGGAARHELLDLPGPSRSCNQRSVRLSGGRWWPGSRVERVLGHVMRSPYTSRFIGARNAKGGAPTMRGTPTWRGLPCAERSPSSPSPARSTMAGPAELPAYAAGTLAPSERGSAGRGGRDRQRGGIGRGIGRRTGPR